MKLNYLSQLRIAFCPHWGTAAVSLSAPPPSRREFIQQVATKKAVKSNPKCQIKVEVLPPKGLWTEVPSVIEVTYSDGSKEAIVPVKGMHVEEIEKIIKRKTEQLELAEEIAELKANPVVGPMPIGSFKGRKHTYAIYAESEETKKRAAGGVKTSKKK